MEPGYERPGESSALAVGGGVGTESKEAMAFSDPHDIKIDSQDRVLVADRGNSRIQVFTIDGTFTMQGFINQRGDSASTAAGLAFSPDPRQQFIYVADQGNSHIHVVDRGTLKVLDSFGRNGEQPGEFQALHHIASDSNGNIYTAEAQRGRRVQKFRFTGIGPAER